MFGSLLGNYAMRGMTTILIGIAGLVVPSAAPAAQKSPEDILARIGAETIRTVNSDLCYPASAEEYEALGKNGVIRLDATSAIATELPLKSVYLEAKGLRIPLRRIVMLEKVEDAAPTTAKGTRYWHQVSFYLAPLNIIRAGARLAADFTGSRHDFGIMTYSPSANGPAFVRLDEYNTPSEPDSSALTALLEREYPDDFASR